MRPTAVQREAMRQLAGIYYSAGRNTMLARIVAARASTVVESRCVRFVTATSNRDREYLSGNPHHAIGR